MRRIAAAAGIAALSWVLAAAAQEAAGPALTADECSRVVEVAERAVPAELAPGFDVRGRPVAPADAGGVAAVVAMPEEIVTPLSVGVFAFLGLTPPAGLEDLAASAGVLSIRLSDGRVTFNGQTLGEGQTQPLVAACEAILEAAANPELPPPPRTRSLPRRRSLERVWFCSTFLPAFSPA